MKTAYDTWTDEERRDQAIDDVAEHINAAAIRWGTALAHASAVTCDEEAAERYALAMFQRPFPDMAASTSEHELFEAIMADEYRWAADEWRADLTTCDPPLHGGWDASMNEVWNEAAATSYAEVKVEAVQRFTRERWLNRQPKSVSMR